MNRFELRVSVEHHDSGSDFLVAGVVIDGTVFGAGEYATSLAALRSSLERDGEHFILTCSCGIPECARLDTGVFVVRAGGVVQWTVREPGPERTYRFDAEAYRSAVERAVEQAHAMVATSRRRGRKYVHVVPHGEEF